MPSEALTVFTVKDQADLKRLEAIVKENLPNWVILAEAMTEIRVRNLYLVTHPTWKDYVTATYKMTVQNANRLIKAKSVQKTLTEGAGSMSGRKLREIGKVPPEQRDSVVEKATRNGKVDPKAVTEAVNEIVPPKAAPVPAPTTVPDAHAAHLKSSQIIADALLEWLRRYDEAAQANLTFENAVWWINEYINNDGQPPELV